MNKLLFQMILPMKSDKIFLDKKEMITSISNSLDIEVYLPSYDLKKPHFNLDETICLMRKVDFIVADLSLERPSCYYELGIAEVLNKKIYLIAIKGTDIHQTSNRSDISFYQDMKGFKSLFTNILKKEILTQKNN